MTLMSARPWKHPKTGVYWYRRRIPADLIDIVGRGEEKFSLRTKDPAEAKRLHAEASELDHLFLFQGTFLKAQALPSALRGCQRFRVQALCLGGVFRPKRELLFAPSDGVNEVCRDASAIPIDSGLWMLPGTG